MTVTVAVAFFVKSAALVAVTYVVFIVVTAGAVYSPEVVMVPVVVDHVTAVLVLPVTAAVNCWVFPENTVAVVGEIATTIRVGLPASAGIEHKTNPTKAAMRFTVPPHAAGLMRGAN